MDIDTQLRIMRAQLSAFDTVMEKIYYLGTFFDPDPEYTREARDIIRGEISQLIKRDEPRRE